MILNRPRLLLSGWIVIFLLIWCLGNIRELWYNFNVLRALGAFSGVAGYLLFSISLLLSSRMNFLEDWICGLDKLYDNHRRIGVWGFCLVLVHPFLEYGRWLPDHLLKVLSATLPIHGRLSMNLGSVAFWMMVVILSLTLIKLLPYDRWKMIHKFMSLVFILSTLHFLLSSHRFGSQFSQWLLLIPMAMGFFSIYYKQVFLPFFAKSTEFLITTLTKDQGRILRVTLRFKDRKVPYKPGQYGFFQFIGPSLTKESHPFTLIGSPQGSTVSILIKARGDYTRRLMEHLSPAYRVFFEGPFGRFSYHNAGQSQIWIAGGIGIAPFLAWIQEISKKGEECLNIDLYYCVHNRNDAAGIEELEQFSKEYPSFRYFLYCSNENKRLTIDEIQAHSKDLTKTPILMCGPIRLTSHFSREFSKLGIPKKNVVFEDFEFF